MAGSGDGCCEGAGCLEMRCGVRTLSCHRVGRPRGGWEGGGAGGGDADRAGKRRWAGGRGT